MYSLTELAYPSRPINPLYDEKLTAFCSHVKEEMAILRQRLETLNYTAHLSQSNAQIRSESASKAAKASRFTMIMIY